MPIYRGRGGRTSLFVPRAGSAFSLSGAPRVVLLGVGLIWCAPIGIDHAPGFGPKFTEGFKVTPLGGSDVSRNPTNMWERLYAATTSTARQWVGA